MKIFVTMALIIVFIPFGVSADNGKSTPYAGNYKYEKYHADYDVNADGTHTETHEIILGVLTEEGVEDVNQADISYSESLQEAVILSAYTLKKDGQRIDVPSENIQERAAIAGGGPMYSDIKTKVIIFPDVAVGDKIGYLYKLIQKQALFPGHFSMTQVYTKFAVFDDVQVSVSVPINSLKLNVFASGVQGGQQRDQEGFLQWIWTYKNQKIATPEYGVVDPFNNTPRIIVSSFKDYADIAAAYETRAKLKSNVTNKVRTLAEKLTRGVTDQQEQAKIIYTWVAKNIHYAGNCIGIGSVVPHDVDMVLANRLGDCKDHAALLQALLAAKKIESTTVLVNAGPNYKLPEIPSLSVINHVINYIFSLDIYADSTSEYTPFGQLPRDVSGKPVIYTANYSGIRQTPITDYKANNSTMKMMLRIHEDGSADGETNNEETGFPASGVKANMAGIQPNMEDRIMRNIIASRGYTGTGTLIKADPQEMSDHYSYGSKYQITNAMNMPGPGAIYFVPVLSTAMSISAALVGLNIPEGKLNFGCDGGTSTEEFTFYLPKNIEVMSLPKDLHLANNTVRYDSTYTKKGNLITAVRKLEDRTIGPVCTPHDHNEFKPIAREILKDLKAQLIYRPTTGK